MNNDVMPLFPKDYVFDTKNLSATQHGVYLLTLMEMWRRGGWVEDDEKALIKICNVSPKHWKKVWADIRPLLIEKDGWLSQKRLLLERKKIMDAEHPGAAAERSVLPIAAERIGATTNATEWRGEELSHGKDERPANGAFAKSFFGKSSELTLSSSKELVVEEDSQQGSKGSKKVEVVAPEPRARAPHTIPDDWTPGESGFAYAKKYGFGSPKAQNMAELFRLHHKGRRTKWSRWDMAWMLWVRNEVEFKGRYNVSTGKHNRGFAALAAKFHEEDQI